MTTTYPACNHTALFEAALVAHINSIKAPQALIEPCKYALLGGGKRLRPRLVLACADALGAPIQEALTPAVAIECIHTFSLIHDDLPAIDNDDFRRGRPTVHKAYDEADAILAGDFLLSFAYELLANCTLPPEIRLKLIQILTSAVGEAGLIGGQMLDIKKHHDLKEVHEKKTGALIRASCAFGAIIANSPKEKELSLFGQKLGLAYQIVDDILDSETLKASFVAAYGRTQSAQKAEELLQEALKLLATIGCKTEGLTSLAIALVRRTY